MNYPTLADFELDTYEYRNYLYRALLDLQSQYEAVPFEKSYQRRRLEERIDRLVDELSTLERVHERTVTQFVRDRSNPDRSPIQRRPAFDYDGFRRNIEALAECGADDLETEHMPKWRELTSKLKKRLDDLKQELAFSNLDALEDSNPFRALPRSLEAVHRLLTQNPASLNFHKIEPFIERVERECEEYLSGDRPLARMHCIMPVFFEADYVEQWVELELNLAGEGYLNPKATLAQKAFFKSDVILFWGQLKADAQELDQLADTLRDAFRYKYDVVGPMSYVARHTRHDPSRSTNLFQRMIQPVRPRFVDENGEPYRNTQVLCWRYHPQKDNALGRTELDHELGRLFTVGILYLDSDGYPTPRKPDFITQGKSEHGHELRAEVDPETGHFMLLEKSLARWTADRKVPYIDDPLTGNWISYEYPDHTANMKQVLDNVDATTDQRRGELDWPPNLFKNSHLSGEKTLKAELHKKDVSGYFDLMGGYSYGFMVLPLGYGSLSIQDLASLPTRATPYEAPELDGAEASNAVAVKYRVDYSTEQLQLPRTLRQLTHELVQARDDIHKAKQHLIQVNAHKREDMRTLGYMAQWVKQGVDAPVERLDPDDISNRKALVEAIRRFQEAIGETVLDPPEPTQVLDKDSRREQHLFQRQTDCKAAAEHYIDVIKRGFRHLNDSKAKAAVNTWLDQQEDLPETVQSDWVSWQLSKVDRSDTTRVGKARSAAEHWKPPVSAVEGLATPYTSLVYDAYAGLLAYLAMNPLPKKLLKSGSDSDEDSNDPQSSEFGEFNLQNNYLAPLLVEWASGSDMNLMVEKVRSVADRSDSLSRSLMPQFFDGKLETELPSSPLSDLIGNIYGSFKTTFIRGPGAPSLMQAVFDLGGQVLKQHYSPHIHSQTQLMVRLYALQYRVAAKVGSRSQTEHLSRVIYGTLAKGDPIAMRRILNHDSLAEWAYGDAQGAISKVHRIEATIKGLDLIYTTCMGVKSLIDLMDGRDQEDPDEHAFQDTLYRIATKTVEYGGPLSTALAAPSQMAYWAEFAAGKGGNSERVAKSLFKKEFFRYSDEAGKAFYGSSVGRWLTAGNNLSKSAMGWANRVCILMEVATFYVNTRNTLTSMAEGDQGDILLNALKTVNSGIFLAAFALNAVPVVGTALFVGGLVMSLAITAWEFYWNNWGQSQWYGDTSVIYDKHWDMLVGQDHALEYKDKDYGASEKMVVSVSYLCEELKKQISRSYYTLPRTIGYQCVEYGPTSANKMTARLTESSDMLLIKKINLIESEMSWGEFSWCAIAKQLDVGFVSRETLLKCIELNDGELSWVMKRQGEDPGLYISDEEEAKAKNEWLSFIENLGLEAEQNSNSPFARIVWRALVSGGRFPKRETEEGEELYTVDQLSNSVTRPSDVSHEDWREFLKCWIEREKTIHGKQG
ncbi:hypothetical protein [Saccharospirillum salsuginis]|uniref:Uncharacterized protein n=1 Tax=Saccharospirillum salsuginis TaxID=418750 RepID=A0A918KFA3_9GAMM|nr:hypothetical protein [Saccharospirillum salsuginis]GGX59529.1 hypothetical protein GCM10007392_29340 [Saccharospirillum salsuginis]